VSPYLTPLSPDAPHPFRRDPDGGHAVGGGTKDARFERAQAQQFFGWTPERCQAVAEREQAHQEWLDSPAGRAWLEAQPWWNAPKPVVRVRELGFQKFPRGGGVMLYNTVSGYKLDGVEVVDSTVTLESLRGQGYAVEVVP